MTRCRGCQSRANRDRYKASPIRLRLLNYLLAHPCVDCGEVDFRKLTFDHVREEKRFNLSAASSLGKTREEVDEEIAKCDVRCASCHLVRTGERAGWYRDVVVEGGIARVVEPPTAPTKAAAGRQMVLGLAVGRPLWAKNAKLDMEQIRTMREEYRAGSMTITALARKHGSTFGAVHSLLVGRTWARAGGPILGRDYSNGGSCERCSVLDCPSPYFSNGLCSAHYSIARRVRRDGSDDLAENEVAAAWRDRVKRGLAPGRKNGDSGS